MAACWMCLSRSSRVGVLAGILMFLHWSRESLGPAELIVVDSHKPYCIFARANKRYACR